MWAWSNYTVSEAIHLFLLQTDSLHFSPKTKATVPAFFLKLVYLWNCSHMTSAVKILNSFLLRERDELKIMNWDPHPFIFQVFDNNINLSTSPRGAVFHLVYCISRGCLRGAGGNFRDFYLSLPTIIMLIPRVKYEELKWRFCFILYVYAQNDFWIWVNNGQLYIWSHWLH